MIAFINRDTEKEISWTVDEYITPELVNKIFNAGLDKKIDWTQTPLYDLTGILLETFSRDEIEEMVYDEDPALIDLIISELDVYILGNTQLSPSKAKYMARLYLPLILVVMFNQ